MSYISSAGITRGTPGYGKTCRKDVLGGVDVPVMPGAAAGARPVPGGRLSSASRCPHAEQVLEDGYHRSSTTRSRLYRWHLYSSWRRNSPQPQSEIARASRRLRTMPETSRSSITIMSCRGPGGCWRGAGSPAGRCGPCGGRGRPWPWPWPGSPSLSGSGPGAAGSGPGCGPCAPGAAGWRSAPRPLVTAKSLTPRSTPTACPVCASGSGASASMAKVTYQRPSGSREMTTIAGSSVVTSTSGHDHTNRTGAPFSPSAARRRAWRTPTGCSARTGGRGGA